MYWDEITLTPEEIEAALIEGKKRKYFMIRNADYWIQQEQNAVDAHEEEKKSKRASYREVLELKNPRKDS